MRFVSLFAGVGGFDLGFEHAGMTCVGQVEIDKHARSVLEKHWPAVPKHDDETWNEGGVAPTLNAFDSGDTRATVIAFSHTQGLDAQPSESAWPTLRNGGGGQAVTAQPTVRRLTPRECERLQGFPDDWTAGQADSHRYRQMGNAVTVNVAAYVGALIMDAMQHDAG